MNVTFEFYTNTYKGTRIKQSGVFDRELRSVERFLSSITMGRDYSNVDGIEYCICEMVDAFDKYSERDGVSSETVGGHSVTYSSKTEDNQSNKQMYLIASTYLCDTGLMNRGIPYVH